MNAQLKIMLQKAVEAFRTVNFDGATSILIEILENDIKNANTIFELGIAYAKSNKFTEALAVFLCLQPYKNDDVRIPYNVGLIHSLRGMHQLALEAYDLALNINPDDAVVLINKGSTCNDLKNYVLAIEVLEKAINIRPDIPEAWSNKGVALSNLNLNQEAIDAYNKAIDLNPSYHEALSNKVVSLNKLKRYTEASEVCDKALALNPDYAEAHYNKGLILSELKSYDEAIAHFDKALKLRPDYHEVWISKGLVLCQLKRYEEAIIHYDRGIQLKCAGEALVNDDKVLNMQPDFAEAWCNKGAALHELKRYDDAITHYDKALSLKPDYHEVWTNKGLALNELKCYDKAVDHYEKALSLKSDIDWLSGDLFHTKMKIGSWFDLADSLKHLFKKVMANEKVTAPYALLSLADDPLLHKKSAEIYAHDKYSFNPILGTIVRRSKKAKIRIGYFSADFKNHPVSLLTAEIFELHDKARFEITAFSFGVDDKSLLRRRLSKAFDKFIDVMTFSDQQIAELSRELGIDIAIDLGGFTQDSRTGIFSHRAAPIQVNWLGYPGTLGCDFIDYIVADSNIISESDQEFYTEKVVYLPDTSMVDDSKRVASSREYTREQWGLPEDKFVFCCFNNDFKFNPKILDSWSIILLGMEHSVLWISENNEFFKANIKTEFEKRGIDSKRIVFAQRVELMADHLARYSLADLFLDTHPYNAHTTALDSLKAGVPVLTLKGQSFASRVAASLLNAIRLPELITNTQEEYEALAIELAMNPEKLADIKLKLAKNRLTTPLFNTPLFTKNLESAYVQMMERYQANLLPDHIYVQ